MKTFDGYREIGQTVAIGVAKDKRRVAHKRIAQLARDTAEIGGSGEGEVLIVVRSGIGAGIIEVELVIAA